MYLKEHLED